MPDRKEINKRGYLKAMTGTFGVSLNPKQIETFKSEGMFGVPT